MAVSDLTGTKWVLNSTISGNNFAVIFNINFISNGNNYSVFYPSFVDMLGEHNLYYGNPNEISVYYDGTWEDQAYRTITITGGTDATNQTLIAWLEANATQVPVADLSGTEWVINSTTCPAGYGQFSINYKIAEGISEQNYELSIGYYYSFDLDSFVTAVNNVWVDRYISLEIDNIVEITDGTDAANPDLIVWLTNNATYQEPTPPQPSTTNNIFFGTSVINKVYFGTSEVSKIYYGNTLIYEVSSGGSGYSVQVSIAKHFSGSPITYNIYDGTDSTGTLAGTLILTDLTGSVSETFTISSGNIYIQDMYGLKQTGNNTYHFFNETTTITENCSLDCGEITHLYKIQVSVEGDATTEVQGLKYENGEYTNFASYGNATSSNTITCFCLNYTDTRVVDNLPSYIRLITTEGDDIFESYYIDGEYNLDVYIDGTTRFDLIFSLAPTSDMEIETVSTGDEPWLSM